jgi:hypothetical protein
MRPVRKADNLTTILCRCHEICGILTSWNPLGHSRPVTGLLYLYFLDALIPQIYIGMKLHVSDSSSVHHQEFFTVHTAMVYVIQVC